MIKLIISNLLDTTAEYDVENQINELLNERGVLPSQVINIQLNEFEDKSGYKLIVVYKDY